MGSAVQMRNLLRGKFYLLLLCFWVSSVTASVTYDRKGLIIDGKRRILISGSIHYPRSTPEMWPDLIQKAKDGGLDVIQTYVFWNGHEPSPGKYYFEDRYDLVKFIKLVQQAGLYVHLRIGPYVCAEWNFGGFPVWLKYVPGIQFRTDNGPFKAAMQKFTTKIVDMMKAEKLYQTQGGPIILSQIENEYGPVEGQMGAAGKAYTTWAAQMAEDLGTGVPWVMCKQDDAPSPVIDTCNGFYCDNYKPNSKNKPKMWTENWTGWYTEFGGAVPRRPAEDLAFSVARFGQSGGSFMNYYMYHGGTNFGTTSGHFIATSYDYDAPLDEYGIPNEPKWGHLKALHQAIHQSEPALVSSDARVTSLGYNLEAHVYKTNSGDCAAFLANYDTQSSAKVTFGNGQYELPPWSISILPDCKTAVFNTARVGALSYPKMTPISGFSWQSYNEEPASASGDDSITAFALWEQVNVTRDSSDYLWYMTDVNIDADEAFIKNGQSPVLTVMSAGHALHVFVDGQLSGTVYGGLGNPKLTFSNGVNLRVGNNKISLLSVAVGLPNVGSRFETWNAGVLGPVTLDGLNEGTRDLSQQKWSYKVGLKGEALGLNTESGSGSVEWTQGTTLAEKQPLTWYKTSFNAPAGNDGLALDLGSMGKGQVWVNGQSIGRHWPAYIAHGSCNAACNYAGMYTEKKCRTQCGQPSQRWYHVPRAWLKPSGNSLVVFEEWGVTASVTYDSKGIIINGKTRILISGSIHYPRSTPQMWPDLIQKAKDGGLDVIQTYVFWNGHEPSPGKYYFEDRYDLVKFIKLVQAAGLYLHLRIGPFACAEWNFGGFPVWLKFVPGIEFRTDNEPFKAAMQKFTTKIVDMMKAEKLFETQGGPIILSQIENEYGPVEWEIGAPGKAYTAWFSRMALSLNTGVPWVMCKQEDAPSPIIDACNGFYCENYKPNAKNKPKMWTENWSGWYTEFGGAVPVRPAEDVAFAVARFIQNGGSFMNYYMFHGGTNFDRTNGLFVVTNYEYDAPLDEYGLPNEPKYGHLKALHQVIRQCEAALVSADATVTWPGQNLEVHEYKTNSGVCAAFLANYNTNSSAKVTYGNGQYELPPWSISILPDCKTAAFNTAKVGKQSYLKDTPVSGFTWQSYSENPESASGNDPITSYELWEQINVTRDSSDYLWYMTEVNIDAGEAFLKNGQSPVLTVMSAGHLLNVFINDQLSGTVHGSLADPRLTFSGKVNLKVGVNKISLLSVAVGLANVGVHFEKWNVGVLGPVTLKGLNKGTMDLSRQKWSYKVGLKGEALGLNAVKGSGSVAWTQGASLAKKQPLTWYKTSFNAPPPAGNEALALDLGSMGKGQVWVNGRSVGRHWPGNIAKGACSPCNYAGTYTDTKCRTQCGQPSQRWYHVPRSWLNPSDNFLVVFEELGGDPTGISLVKRTRTQ
ncbi:hypothetical protein L6164_013963 [Bauhinia variegata]|uniref:Uncharacterized protein n=1 Tax=Bauhinia variegata TaxID=167791 RepID=A0ACB9NG07_BAUVA|nr:hypothetical protein L6164_013963 [Bauhinia variegata]